MKRINLILFLSIIVFSFSSCEEEDTFNITGTWTQESLEMSIDLGIPGQSFNETIDDPTTYIFNEDGTGEVIDDMQGITTEFTWEYQSDLLTINFEDTALEFELTTKTDTRVVGQQAIPIADILVLLGDTISSEELEALEAFSSLAGNITITLTR